MIDLLKPRYKVIADWPTNQYFKVGDILTSMPRWGENCFGKRVDYTIGDAWVVNPEKYQANLIELNWWEDRLTTDMPQYVVDKGSPKIMYKVYGWLQNCAMFYFAPDEISITHTEYFLPATLEEYQSQKL